jgi:2-methylaconitate cis-trans-isomerase PrpF
LAETIQEATQQSQAVPKIACVSAPKPYQTLGGKTVKIAEVDLVARMMSMGTLHKSFAVSGAVATAGAARIPGTVVHDLISLEASKKEIMRLGHPGGIIEVGAVVKETRGNFNYKEAILGRTARRESERKKYEFQPGVARVLGSRSAGRIAGCQTKNTSRCPYRRDVNHNLL